jgi:hypothetical protein
MRIRPALRWLAVLALALLAGCSESPSEPQPRSTPLWEQTIRQFVSAYENQSALAYEQFFTGDFTFEFSLSADPTLANQWSTGWFKSDEVVAARHLFQGGTNLDGKYLPAANSIDLILTKTVPLGDTEAGRDSTKYKVLSTPVDAMVVAPPDTVGGDPVYYAVTNNSHRFYLVRGDAAAALAEWQPADSLHWYIWQWKDETMGVDAMPIGKAGPAARPTPTASITWGKLKGVYR